jgi:general stress protein 26
MKTQTQTSPERTRLCKLIEGMTVATLTNADGDGALVSRPMSPLEMDGDGAIWFFCDLLSIRVEDLSVVNLSFSDEGRATYVSLSGHGELHTDQAHIARLWAPFARPWFPDGPASTHLGLLKFIPETAEYWDAPHSKMVRMLGMVAAVVAGKPLGQGEQRTPTAIS